MSRNLLDMVVQFHLPALISTVVWWTALGAVAGLLLGLLAFLRIRAAGGYDLEVRPAKWLRALACLVAMAAGLVAFAVIGFGEGILSGVTRLSRDEHVRGSLAPQVGRSGALLVAGMYSAYPLLNGSPRLDRLDGNLDTLLDSFTRGKWEVDVRELSRRLANTPTTAVNVALRSIRRDIRLRCPELNDSRSGKAALWLLDELAQLMLPSEAAHARTDLERSDLAEACKRILRGLPAEAARSGNPSTISYAELSSYIAGQSLESVVVGPLRRAVRSQEVSSGMGFIITLGVTVLAFRFAEHIRRRVVRRLGG